MNINIHMYPHKVRFKSWFLLVVKNENLDDPASNHSHSLTPSQVVLFLTHGLYIFLLYQQSFSHSSVILCQQVLPAVACAASAPCPSCSATSTTCATWHGETTTVTGCPRGSPCCPWWTPWRGRLSRDTSVAAQSVRQSLRYTQINHDLENPHGCFIRVDL